MKLYINLTNAIIIIIIIFIKILIKCLNSSNFMLNLFIVLFSMTIFFAIGLILNVFVSEKIQGLMDRSCVAGNRYFYIM